MSTFRIFRETALPTILLPDSVYLVAPPAAGNYIEFYVVNSAGSVKRIPTESDIASQISAAIAVLPSANNLFVVSNIAARNALAPTINVQVLVKDASADPTVTTGAAAYIFDVATTTWTKIFDYNHVSMNLVLDYSNIINGPSSTAAAIDAAVGASHTHANKAVLDALTDVGGILKYNGTAVQSQWTSTNW
jgi:hypothetical protein